MGRWSRAVLVYGVDLERLRARQDPPWENEEYGRDPNAYLQAALGEDARRELGSLGASLLVFGGKGDSFLLLGADDSLIEHSGYQPQATSVSLPEVDPDWGARLKRWLELAGLAAEEGDIGWWLVAVPGD